MTISIQSKYLTHDMEVCFLDQRFECKYEENEADETISISLYKNKKEVHNQTVKLSDWIHIWIDVEDESATHDILIEKLGEYNIPSTDAKTYAQVKLSDIIMRKDS